MENKKVKQQVSNTQQPTNTKVVYVEEAKNNYAIAGFVLAFFFNILGITFSVKGLKKSEDLNGKGRGLSIAGIVISVLTVVIGLIVAFAFITGKGFGPRN